MKKFVLLVAILSVCVGTSWADVLNSKFGFQMTVPPNQWTIITAEELKKNPDLLNFDNPAFKNTDKKLIQDITSMVGAGRMEVLFRKITGQVPAFVDNVNLFVQAQPFPGTDSEIKEICNSLPGALSQALGKAIKIHQCGSTQVNGKKAVYLEFDGVVEGTTSLQYQIELAPNSVLVTTATGTNQNVAQLRQEFQDMVKSIR